MALLLDDSQQGIVDAKRKPEDQRPQYFNAGTGNLTTISTDFEAFLILQGRQRNADTTKWLEQCSDFEVRDLGRDALAATALQNEIDDATIAQLEVFPFIDLFSRFKASYKLTGFENVVEAGLLLEDLQKPMLELQSLVGRLRHRVQYGRIALNDLLTNGITSADQQEIDSWFASLSAY